MMFFGRQQYVLDECYQCVGGPACIWPQLGWVGGSYRYSVHEKAGLGQLTVQVVVN
jgi:hypothetical protein